MSVVTYAQRSRPPNSAHVQKVRSIKNLRALFFSPRDARRIFVAIPKLVCVCVAEILRKITLMNFFCQMLDENSHLIQSIQECQNKGRPQECLQ